MGRGHCPLIFLQSSSIERAVTTAATSSAYMIMPAPFTASGRSFSRRESIIFDTDEPCGTPIDEDSGSDSEVSNQSDSEDSSRPSTPINKAKKTPVKKDNQKKQPRRTELNAGQIAKLLIDAVDNGLSEALLWLAENLEEVALDQEAEGFDPTSEGTPLVTISKDSAEAMENELFRKVLAGVGVVPPFDEQEKYWRIPSSLHFETIRKRREIILKAVNKELIIDATDLSVNTNDVADTANEADVQSDRPNAESSDDDDVFDNLRKMRDNNEQNLVKSTYNSSANKASRNNKRSRSYNSDDETSRNKMQKIDETDENERDDDDDDILSFAKRTLQQNDLPDTEDILSNIPRNDSDDSEDDEIVGRKSDSRKRRPVIDDDSDS